MESCVYYHKKEKKITCDKAKTGANWNNFKIKPADLQDKYNSTGYLI